MNLLNSSETPSFEILISPTNTDNDDDNRKSLILTLAIIFSKEVCFGLGIHVSKWLFIIRFMLFLVSE